MKTAWLGGVVVCGLVVLGACEADHAQHCLDVPGAAMVATGERVLTNVDGTGLALQGYDPVAYFSLPAGAPPVKGDPAFRSVYRGGTYWFASAENKARFDADPARYEPRFGGWCGYAASINKLSPIGPEYWEIIDGRLVLQHNEKAWRLWHEDVRGNLKKAESNWPGLVDTHGRALKQLVNIDERGVAIQGYDPVAYFADGKPARGVAAHAAVYKGVTYWFTSDEHRAAFEASPEKYVPRFGGFCGYAASINKVSPVDPEIWQIVDGRLVLQHTREAYDLFNKDAEGNYRKSEVNWPGLTHRACGSHADGG